MQTAGIGMDDTDLREKVIRVLNKGLRQGRVVEQVISAFLNMEVAF